MARKTKRRGGLGEIKRSKRKVSKAALRVSTARGYYGDNPRKIPTTVTVSRVHPRLAPESAGKYAATACVASAPGTRVGKSRKAGQKAHKRCGYSIGKTPTQALKKAFASLSKTLR